MADSNNEIANLKIMNEVRIFSGLQNLIKKIYKNTILYTYLEKKYMIKVEKKNLFFKSAQKKFLFFFLLYF